MRILEYGDTSKRKIILIHGFQSPWQVWEKYIEYYKEDFHIIVPIVPGHDPEEKTDFISFSETAKEIEDHIISHYDNKIYAAYGMSMGGVVAATLWQNKQLEFEKIIFDGSPLVSVNGLMKKYIVSFYLNVTHKSQQRDKKTLEQANSICSKEHFEYFLKVLDNMSDATIINCNNCIADFKLNSDIGTSTEIYYFYGTAINETLAKKSAKYIKKHYPSAVIKCFEGKGHCENAIFAPDVMIKELDKVLI